MLEQIIALDDPRLSLIKDDPVRPHIPAELRINDRGTIYLWVENNQIQAAVCVMLCSRIPDSEQSMLEQQDDVLNVAVAYTIWSYSKGAAQQLIFAVRETVKDRVSKLVTLSPQTEMAKNFHIKNGAVLIRENAQTWNFEYSLCE